MLLLRPWLARRRRTPVVPPEDPEVAATPAAPGSRPLSEPVVPPAEHPLSEPDHIRAEIVLLLAEIELALLAMRQREEAPE